MQVMFVNVVGANIGTTTSDKIIIPRIGDKVDCNIIPAPIVNDIIFSFKKNMILVSIDTIFMNSIC